MVGYTRARVSPRATFPGNGRVIPRVTQVPSATEGEIVQPKNSGADLRLSRFLSHVGIHPSIFDDSGANSGDQKRGMLVAVGRRGRKKRNQSATGETSNGAIHFRPFIFAICSMSERKITRKRRNKESGKRYFLLSFAKCSSGHTRAYESIWTFFSNLPCVTYNR